MKITLAEIAERVGGTLQGDGSLVIEGAAGLSDATDKDISFLGNPKYKDQLKTTQAAALLLPEGAQVEGKPFITTKNPLYGWARILELVAADRSCHPQGIHPGAHVASTARLGKNVSLGAGAVVDEHAEVGDDTVLYSQSYVGPHSKVGRGCVIYSQVSLREYTQVGDRCIFHPGVVLGGDGYGFTVHEGRHYKIPQVGWVEVGNDVEIGSNTTVDRGTTGPTRIGDGTKIDNLVQIAHNVQIGQHCLVVAQSGVAGSAKLGNYVTIAAQAGVGGHVNVGDGVICAGRGGISHDIKPKQVVWGMPAQPIKEEMKMQASLRRLPKLLEEYKQIKKKLGI